MNRNLLTVLILAAIFWQSAHSFEIKIDRDKQQVKAGNQFYSLEINYASGIQIQQFTTGGNHFLWPHPDHSSHDSRRSGWRVRFYKEHPLSATPALNLPASYTAEQQVIDATHTAIILRSNDPDSVRFTQRFLFHKERAMFTVQTAIDNHGDESLTLYPTEEAAWNAELKNSGFPNMNSFVNIPVNQKSSFQIRQGGTNNQQITYDSQKRVLQAQYKNVVNEVLANASSNWMAFLIGRNPKPQVLALKQRYSNQRPFPVEDNTYLFINGAGEFEQNGKTIKQELDAEKYMLTKRVLGKITINPGETFDYNTDWTSSRCPAPIINVDNGIVYNEPFQVYRYEQRFLLFAIMGIPQEGHVVVNFYDKDNQLLKSGLLSLLLNPNPAYRRPGKAVIEHPTVLHHDVAFDVEASQEVIKQTHAVRLYLQDDDRNDLMLIKEALAPFEEYTPEKQSR